MAIERSTAQRYRDFGVIEARGQSPVFEEWALGVAGDPGIVALIDELPLQKRQPNLVFAAARLLGSPIGGYPAFRAWLSANWPAVAFEAERRMTQTNEPRRCAALLPALARLDGPLALLELGASAGLCLYPDRYSYRYGDGDWLHPASGPSTVTIETALSGSTGETLERADTAHWIPHELPGIAWRAGIDLHPLDVRDDEDVCWLETLVWPEQEERLARIRAAIAIVRENPPTLFRGDALDRLEDVAATRPTGTTLVVVTSAMLVYVPYLQRMRLVDAIRRLDAHWVSLDGVGVLPDVDARHPSPQRGRFTLSIDGEPLADVGPHGQFVEWIGPASANRAP
ncbi:hypothetical protein BKA04_000972 [Cryobacterium mesophilum]|uniref:DUF2332 domain-containing protein n=1 Tax=Terrimesophilobacter mesophilus TaxID=433647 RepID=A0A4R8VB27_9MICO|nr:DUF2332 domain-containing protein [Terrimesophilobacter mesophilus]MBB5632749.1 hypothetical protein [Terrimesophilobacter mesophilus]TFB79546.1 DUF2332 domain-containing protein [Terrimesophilobacter mesophilus]